MEPVEVRSLNFYHIAKAQDVERGSNGLDFDWIKAAYERLTDGKGLLSFEEAVALNYRSFRAIVEADGTGALMADPRMLASGDYHVPADPPPASRMHRFRRRDGQPPPDESAR